MVYERSDLASDLPENTRYKDEGCSLADSCLRCPFPCCVYDSPGSGTRLYKEGRNREIIRLARTGKRVKELALKFGVSRRTIQRVLRRTDGGSTNE